MFSNTIRATFAFLLLALPAAAFAQPIAPELVEVAVQDKADNAWMLTATALVMLMALPGLALFYGGRVQSKNFLSIPLQCAAITAVVSLIWVLAGYSLVYSPNGSDWIGTLQNLMLGGTDAVRDDMTIGEPIFALFRMMVAVFAVVLMTGAWAERARLGWVLAFSAVWTLIVFLPVSRWVWGGGWLADMGVFDVGNGLTVQTTAGVSALVVALMLGQRTGWPQEQKPLHSPGLALAGAGLLWVGWFGLNGGGELEAEDLTAGAAIINTHVAASVGLLTWMLLERLSSGRVTGIGVASGAIAGLAGVSAGASYVGPGGAVVIALVSSLLAFFAGSLVHKVLRIDDTMNVFALHGVTGMTGALLVAFFADGGLGGIGYAEGAGIGSQIGLQLVGIGTVAVWSIVGTVIAGYMVSLIFPMRVSPDAEREGLDIRSSI